MTDEDGFGVDDVEEVGLDIGEGGCDGCEFGFGYAGEPRNC